MSGPDVAGAGAHIQVAHGKVTRYRGIRFGGIACVTPTSDACAWIRIAIRDETREIVADLREGDTVCIAAQTWRLPRIDGDRRRWWATLVRVD